MQSVQPTFRNSYKHSHIYKLLNSHSVCEKLNKRSNKMKVNFFESVYFEKSRKLPRRLYILCKFSAHSSYKHKHIYLMAGFQKQWPTLVFCMSIFVLTKSTGNKLQTKITNENQNEFRSFEYSKMK